MSFRLVCTNGMISATAQRKYHVGKKSDSIDAMNEILQDSTKALNDKAFWASVNDLITYNLSDIAIQKELSRMNNAASTEMVGDTVEIINSVSKQYGLNETQNKSILDHLIKGADLSQWGLANAITRTAEDQDSYDDASKFEAVGGKIIELDKTQFSRLG